ncbi:hypothetical protein KFE25_012179 [Diacronema lutheri]|uniref:Peptidase S54 rhomboid domain-containing protein n=1 Tax=Diacronema lutheri TaxID=2081491 RepID=A0A8J5XDD0_DIALT|nr:hypothetical protein KFE25_012179 [Diacronema lutheri]
MASERNGQFVLSLLPVAGAMLAVPRLSDVRHDSRRMRDMMRNLAYSEANVAEGRWWTQFTFAFVHRDETHLGSNLLTLVPFAYAVHAAFGCAWVPIFLGGSFFGAQDAAGKRLQAARRISEPLSLRDWAPKPAADAVDKVTRRVATWLAPSVTRSMTYVGASAGVWALQGTAVCLSLEQLIALCSTASYDELNRTTVAAHLWSIFAVTSEYVVALQKIATGSSDGIDHAGHVDGFVFGIGVFALLRFAQAVGRRRRRLPLVRGGVLLSPAVARQLERR